MKQILCYGDSNTHGFDAFTGGRFDYQVRWTGLLGEALRGQVLVCEAGLNGRTCGFEDPEVPGRNGVAYLDCALQTHKPLDAVLLMLGTNDSKRCFQADGPAIARQMEKLIDKVQQFSRLEGKDTKILLVAPVPLGESCLCYSDFGPQSVEVSQTLGGCYRQLAEKRKIAFADSGAWEIQLDFDGVHFTPEGHRQFARRITREVERLLEL